MTQHEEWTDKLSDFLDDELTPDERYAVESHLQGCVDCAAVLEELKQVVARARTLEPRPSRADLWPGIAAQIEQAEHEAASATPILPFGLAQGGPFGLAQGGPMRTRAGWRVTFTLPQLAAASLLLAAMSGGLAWSLVVGRQSSVVGRESSVVGRESSVVGRESSVVGRESSVVGRESAAVGRESAAADERPMTNDQRPTTNDEQPTTNDQILQVSLADAQYDAAVLDLERALKDGRGKLDPATVTIVEHNLQTIDEAIRQAREALASDPANSYLSGHLVEARRRKLDLLRRATALTTSESD